VAQGRYTEAEPLLDRSLAIREGSLGPEHPTSPRASATSPGSTRCRSATPEHPDVAHSLVSLALLYDLQGRYAEAEPLHRRALAILEQAHGPEHPEAAALVGNLAMGYAAAASRRHPSGGERKKTPGPQGPGTPSYWASVQRSISFS
jgi:tetratricopeptide (TPR) repeat protein